MTDPETKLPLFAVTAPGLEPVAEAELRAMGIAATAESGGVAWSGTVREMYEANLGLRTASRVLVRVADFRARTFWELERRAAKIPWDRFMTPGRAVRFRTTSRKSKLFHEGAIEQRLRAAVERRVGPVVERPAGDEEEDEGSGEQLFVVRFHYDRCTLSVDSSGALLHRRGYRQAVAKAPLRETLAAAMLLASGWDRRAPLLDPFCGSGTIPIEAALLARDIAPALASADRRPRHFAFLEWPDFDAALWAEVVERAVARIAPAAPALLRGSDRDEGAIAAARANAERAGVLDDLALETLALSAVEPVKGGGWLVTNPPYGVRVGESAALRNLYAALGQTARRTLRGGTVALLAAEPRLEKQTGIPFEEVLRTRNGGIPVRLVVGKVE